MGKADVYSKGKDNRQAEPGKSCVKENIPEQSDTDHVEEHDPEDNKEPVGTGQQASHQQDKKIVPTVTEKIGIAKAAMFSLRP